ncbi:uncharacterized protein BX664DRAFT_381201 [Halteromyces radiatus]|uniref:uncharacterized protein n=1 Tax=Halteromyces radiatus TaxID=101107 RepID=UPI0022200058|nr:uncharacterized protein BX664DRAFT_381201 [Halteromyces radiatus]KAI8098490.1 hypothetical protein BX664DRAFT_381201 [Halteromyces radiatus]
MQFIYAQSRTNPSFYCIVIDTLTLAHDPRYQNSGLYSQMSDGHHYFILSFWSDEDHGVLIFVCLRAMDLVEDDQSLESFMNLVTEFCAQVGGGQNATPFISLRANCYDDIGFTGGTKHSMVQPRLQTIQSSQDRMPSSWNDPVRHPIEVSVSNKIVLPKVQVMIVVLVMALVVILVVCSWILSIIV